MIVAQKSDPLVRISRTSHPNTTTDSERHYGTDYEEEAEFARQAGGRAGQGARASVEPSVVGTEDDEALSPDEESAEEELSDDE